MISDIKQAHGELELNLNISSNEKGVELPILPILEYEDKELHIDSDFKLTSKGLKMKFNNIDKNAKKSYLKVPSLSFVEKASVEEVELTTQSKKINLNNEEWLDLAQPRIEVNEEGETELIVNFTSKGNFDIYPGGAVLNIKDHLVSGGVYTIFNNSGKVDRGFLIFTLPKEVEFNEQNIGSLQVKDIVKKVDGNWKIEIPLN